MKGMYNQDNEERGGGTKTNRKRAEIGLDLGVFQCFQDRLCDLEYVLCDIGVFCGAVRWSGHDGTNKDMDP